MLSPLVYDRIQSTCSYYDIEKGKKTHQRMHIISTGKILISNIYNSQIYLMDIHIWYTLLSAIIGGVMGARARLGEVIMYS